MRQALLRQDPSKQHIWDSCHLSPPDCQTLWRLSDLVSDTLSETQPRLFINVSLFNVNEQTLLIEQR